MDGVALIDHAMERLRTVTGAIAVNAHRSQPTLVAHVDALDDVHLSIEDPEALGTAGALGALRDWIDGRAVVVVNGDTWCPGGLERLVEGWNGTSIRILVAGTERFGPRSRVAGALMPFDDVAALSPTPSGLWEVSWRQAASQGRVDTVVHDGPFVDCARPVDYLRANLLASGGSSVSPDALVEGTVIDSVVWPGATVVAGETLRSAIRTPQHTVLVRPVSGAG